MADIPSKANKTLNKEEVDIRILRLLGLEEVFDIDYDTYISLLKEQLVLSSLGKRTIPREEEILLQNEYKRIKNKKGKGRFKPKKKITAEKFIGGALVKTISFKKTQVVAPKQKLIPQRKDSANGELKSILDSLSKIVEQLTSFNDLTKTDLDNQRKNKENLKRKVREEELETKFDVVEKIAEKVISPVKSILQRIIDSLLAIFIGKALIQLLRWFSDEKNQSKIRAIGRFLGDHWPKLLALYIAFGTGLGKFARGLIGIVVKGTGALIKAAVGLAARAGLKGAGKFSKFLGGPKGKLIGAAVELGAVAVGTVALSKGIEDFGGIGLGGETTETQPVAKFSGGGFANFANLFKGASMGSIFGPMGMSAGAATSGLVSGEKGIDKVPAMLTDGEFVMSRGAVEKYGVDTLESMNAAAGGTNKPKVVQGTTYAAGGGLVGDNSRSRLRSATRSLTPDVAEGLRTQKFTTLWHGTSDIYKKMIESGGIDPKKFTFGALGEGFYTTPDQKIARLYAEQAAELSGGKPAIVRLSVPTDVLKQYTANVRDKGRVLSGNELIQYTDNFRPQLRGNTRSSNMYVWGGRGQITPEGFGPRIGNIRQGGLSMSQQYQAANLANRFGRTGTTSTIRSSQAPQRWMDRFISGGPKIEERTARVSRQPIPASRAIVPYAGGGLARTGVTAGLSNPPIQQIYTNMKVPGGGGRGGLVGTIATTLLELFAPQIQSAIGGLYNQMGIGMGNLSDKELQRQITEELKSQKRISSGPFGNILSKDNERLSLLQQEMNRRKTSLKGGAIKGGWGLKEQSFKDAPKTQVMVDDKGRPFVGHKAMRDGKLVYVRGPQPGTGTTNPLEALGRMINPNAYKENDARLARGKHREAMVNSLESLRAQGASIDTQKTMMKRMGGNLKDVENDLNYRKKTKAKIASGELRPDGRKRTGQEQMRMKISKSQKKKAAPAPPPKPKVKVKYNPAGGGMGGKRGSGSKPSTGGKAKVPQFNSSVQSITRNRNAATYGLG